MNISLISERGYTEQHEKRNKKVIETERIMNKELSFFLYHLLENQGFSVCLNFYNEQYTAEYKQLKLKERQSDIAITINCRIYENETFFKRSKNTTIYINRDNAGDSKDFANKIAKNISIKYKNEKCAVKHAPHKITDCKNTCTNSSIVIQQSYLLSTLLKTENETMLYLENIAECIAKALCEFLKQDYVESTEKICITKDMIVREEPRSISEQIDMLLKGSECDVTYNYKGWRFVKSANGWIYLHKGNHKKIIK